MPMERNARILGSYNGREAQALHAGWSNSWEYSWEYSYENGYGPYLILLLSARIRLRKSLRPPAGPAPPSQHSASRL